MAFSESTKCAIYIVERYAFSDVFAPSHNPNPQPARVAIAFAKASVLGRSSGGRSVAAHLAYREASTLGGYDYTPRRASVVESYLVGWAGTSEEFAGAVEASEKRKDAQLVREIAWALPHDATDEQRSEIVRREAESLRQRYGVAVHVAIHAPRAKDQNTHGLDASGKNHHAHLTITLRAVDAAGKFTGNKLRQMNDRSWLDEEKDRLLALVNEVAETKATRELKYGEPVPTAGVAWHMHRAGVETTAGARLVHAIAEREETTAARAELAEVATEVATTQAELVAAEQAEAELAQRIREMVRAAKVEAEKAERDRLAKIEAEKQRLDKLAAEQAAARAQAAAVAAAKIETEKAAAQQLYERTQADLTDAIHFAADAIERAAVARGGVGQDHPRLAPDGAGARPGARGDRTGARVVARVRACLGRVRAVIARRRIDRASAAIMDQAVEYPRCGDMAQGEHLGAGQGRERQASVAHGERAMQDGREARISARHDPRDDRGARVDAAPHDQRGRAVEHEHNAGPGRKVVGANPPAPVVSEEVAQPKRSLFDQFKATVLHAVGLPTKEEEAASLASFLEAHNKLDTMLRKPVSNEEPHPLPENPVPPTNSLPQAPEPEASDIPSSDIHRMAREGRLDELLAQDRLTKELLALECCDEGPDDGLTVREVAQKYGHGDQIPIALRLPKQVQPSPPLPGRPGPTKSRNAQDIFRPGQRHGEPPPEQSHGQGRGR